MARTFVIGAMALGAAACGPSRPGSGSTSGDASGGGPAGAAGASNLGDLAFVAEPSFTGNENDAAPQVGIVRLETNRPSFGVIEVSGAGETWSLPLTPEKNAHEVAVVGVLPDTPYEVTIRLKSDSDRLVHGPLTWRSPSLPEGFPNLELVTSDPSRMQPGMTLLDARLSRYLVVVDNEARVRWHYHAERVTTGHQLLANRRLLFVSGKEEIIEIDWLGNTTARWHAARTPEDFTPATDSVPVDVEAFRHTVEEMPDGNILTLSEEVRTIDEYPTSTSDRDAPTASAEVRGEIILEFARSGDIVKSVHLFDVLDETRVGYDSVGGGGVQEWTHCNSVTYDSESDAFLVSSRHQDAAFKIDRETEALVWILGDPANWREPFGDSLLTPRGAEFEWAYHHHAVEVTPDGVGLFDNGNYGAPAFEEPKPNVVSRAVRYAIDEGTMTVEQVFSHGPTFEDNPLHAIAMGDADFQSETGNTLITSGTLVTDTTPSEVWVQLLEVSDDNDVVFELHMRGDSGANTSSFEADRIADIRFSSAEQ